jgi:ubiquinone/menaquinone biosynthesis C-methylase UbiE
VQILNVGSGMDRSISDAVTIDINPGVRPDVVHDLNQVPWPFPDNSFDAIYCKEVIEHMGNVIAIMEEMHRIGRPGAMVQITTPHFSCANSFTDPTHLHHLGFFSFDYFTGQNQWDFYTKARFKKLKSRLEFYGRYKNFHISWLANKYPRFYEEHLTWIFPAWYMVFELEVMK